MTHIYLWGFVFGTFKFLFSHWTIFAMAAGMDVNVDFFDIFIPTTAGAILSMAIFYFSSDLLMERAAKKRQLEHQKAIEANLTPKMKNKFTWINKFMVRLKSRLGIFGITLLGPLFLSIPVGSIVCAKFYGDKKKTFPLMVLFMILYSLIMCSIIYLVN